MIPLQAETTSQVIKDLSGIERVTVYGVLFLVIVGLVVYLVYLIRKTDKKEETDRLQKEQMIDVLKDVASNTLGNREIIVEVKKSLEDVRDGNKEILIYIRKS